MKKWKNIYIFDPQTTELIRKYLSLAIYKYMKKNIGKGSFPKASRNNLMPTQELVFSKGIFSGLIICDGYIRIFEFSNVRIEKRITQWVRSYYSHKLHLLHELRDANMSYLSKDKEDIISSHYSFH